MLWCWRYADCWLGINSLLSRKACSRLCTTLSNNLEKMTSLIQAYYRPVSNLSFFSKFFRSLASSPLYFSSGRTVLVDMWRLIHQWSFLLFWLFLTIGTLLVQSWYRPVTIGTPMAIFAVLTVFWLFLTIGTLLVHCWYSLGRPVTIGTPMVILKWRRLIDHRLTIGMPL